MLFLVNPSKRRRSKARRVSFKSGGKTIRFRVNPMPKTSRSERRDLQKPARLQYREAYKARPELMAQRERIFKARAARRARKEADRRSARAERRILKKNPSKRSKASAKRVTASRYRDAMWQMKMDARTPSTGGASDPGLTKPCSRCGKMNRSSHSYCLRCGGGLKANPGRKPKKSNRRAAARRATAPKRRTKESNVAKKNRKKKTKAQRAAISRRNLKKARSARSRSKARRTRAHTRASMRLSNAPRSRGRRGKGRKGRGKSRGRKVAYRTIRGRRLRRRIKKVRGYKAARYTRNPSSIFAALKDAAPIAVAMIGGKVGASFLTRIPVVGGFIAGLGNFAAPVGALAILAAAHFGTKKGFLAKYRTPIMLGLGVNVIHSAAQALLPASIKGAIGMGGVYDEALAAGEYFDATSSYETVGDYADMADYEDLGDGARQQQIASRSMSSPIDPWDMDDERAGGIFAGATAIR